MLALLALLMAYFLGSIPFGYLMVRAMAGADIREAGSGNIGATNVLRTTGRAAGIATLVLDIAKGYAAVYLTARLTHGDLLWTSLAALAVMAGHAYPIFLGFRGGKAVATFLGAYALLAPLPLLAVLLVFFTTVMATRFISLGSILAAGTFPLAVWLIDHPGAPLVASALVSGAFIVYRHRDNIQRLHAGTERIFRFSGKRPA